MKYLLSMLACLAMMPAAYAQTAEDFEAAESAYVTTWDEMPLTQRKVNFIAAPSPGVGRYDVRENNIFKKGELIISYAEPIGYKFRQLQDGQFEFGVVVDMLIKDGNGTVVTDQKAFYNSQQANNVKNRYMSIDISLTLTGAEVGKYTVSYTVNDIVSGQTSTFDQAFEIVD